MMSAQARKARRSSAPTRIGQWVQKPDDMAKMLAAAGVGPEAMGHAPAWVELWHDGTDCVVRMPLNETWSAWIWRKPDGMLSFVACVPTIERPADTMPRREFFNRVFPKKWITAARASLLTFDPEAPLANETRNIFRVGFPCIGMLRETDDARICGIAMVRAVDTAAMITRAETRFGVIVLARQWIPIDRNILGAAVLWHRDQTQFANYRFCRMVIGQTASRLRKRGISITDAETTADMVQSAADVTLGN